MFGIPWVLLLVDRECRSTLTILLYHMLLSFARLTVLPGAFHRFAKRSNDLRGERDPAWSQRGGAHTLQAPNFAPLSNRRDIDVEQIRCGPGRIASISSLSRRCRLWPLWASGRNVIRIANPLDLANGKRASHARLCPFLVQQD